jgi:hypothetical protein
MDDIASLFFEDDGAQQKLRAKAMADALRQRQGQADAGRAIGNLGLLTGDKVLGGFGQAQIGSADKMGARIGEDQQQLGQIGAQRLTRALQAQQLAQGKQELDEASAPANAIYGDLARKFGVSLPNAMTNQQAREALGLAEKGYSADMRGRELALTREAMRGNREAALAEKGEKTLDKQIETLSKRLEGAPALKQDLATLNQFAGQEDIPGVGSAEGRLPDFAAGLFNGADATRVRQAARGLYSNILKEQSGSTVSEQELKRKLEELGMGPGATEENFRLGLARLTEMAHATLRAKEAGARPEAVEEASRRGLTTSRDLPKGQAGGLTSQEAAELAEYEKKYGGK